jgi:type II secretory pathway pseudopilin PulG
MKHERASVPSMLRFKLTQIRRAFSLVELLTALGLIAVVVALLLPAIQATRESARRAQCQNNLKQIGIALLHYHNVYGSFPHGGWGHEWVGVPDRGIGKRQPGGWIFSLLPFIEEQGLHRFGQGQQVAEGDLVAVRLRTPVCLLVCASRRNCARWPVSDKYPYVRSPKPFGAATEVARSDYAINGGSSVAIVHGGPTDFLQGDDEKYWRTSITNRKISGVSHIRFAAALRSITDGASKTYLVGEKYVESAWYETGESLGDNESQYAGYCTDLNRFAGAVERLALSQSPVAPPLNDNAIPGSGLPGHSRFGSAHAEGLNMLTCDGSLRFMGFDVDPDIHFRLGYRNDSGDSFESLLRAN